MRRISTILLAVMLTFGVALNAHASELKRVGWISVGPFTSVPEGWIDFCNRYGTYGMCDVAVHKAQRIKLTEKTLKEVQVLNRWVNKIVAPVSDMDHWGVVDQWDYPLDHRGDCEDYALFKRRLLADKGYPVQALLITVVRDLNGDGHAVLTIVTDHGDFILDNLNDEVKAWSETGYRYFKRQSQTDPNMWVLIDTNSVTTATIRK